MSGDTTVPNLDERRVWWTIEWFFAGIALDLLATVLFHGSVIAQGVTMVIEVAVLGWLWRSPEPFSWLARRKPPC